MTDLPATPDPEATPDRLLALVLAGHLPGRDYARAIAMVRDDRAWARLALWALALAGLAQILFGIVFFFAANWDELGRWARLGIIEGGIVMCGAGALWAGLDRSVGRGLGIACTVLVGVLLAVIGQSWQTGADDWMLFAKWAAFTLPLALVALDAVHLLLWTAIAMTALGLWLEQVAAGAGWLEEASMLAAPALAPALVLLGREAMRPRLPENLRARWLGRALLLAALTPLLFGATDVVFEGLRHGQDVVVSVLFLAAAGGGLWGFFRPRPDFPCLCLAGLALALWAAALAGKLIFEALPDSMGGLGLSCLLTAGAVIGIFATLVRQLARLRGLMEGGVHG